MALAVFSIICQHILGLCSSQNSWGAQATYPFSLLISPGAKVLNPDRYKAKESHLSF